MFYEFDLTLPANTAEASPVTSVVKLAAGTLTRIGVQFPLGCKGLAHVYIRRALYQVYPVNPAGNVKADGAIIETDESYLLDQPPFEITLYGWNDDDSYSHTITFRFVLAPRTAAAAGTSSPSAIQRILSALSG